MNIRHKLILPSANLSVGMCGVYLAMYQISLLQIAQKFDLSSLMMGVLISVQYIGICLPPLFLGSLSERIGKKGVLMIALPLMVIGTFLVAVTSSLIYFIIGILLCGAGYSVTEGTMSATLATEFSEKSAKHLGISQAVFSLGAVLSPFACEALFSAGYSYNNLFGMVSALLLAVFILFSFTKYKKDIKGSSHSGIRSAFAFFFKKNFLFLSIAILLYMGIEEGIAFFADSYFELTLGTPQYSALALSLFWVGMIPSRLFLGAIRLRHKTTVTICAVGVLVSILLIIAFPSSTVKLVSYGFLGLFAGPTWPIIMDIVSKKYPKNAGTVSNLMMSTTGLGGATMPLLAGALVVGANFIPTFIVAGLCAAGMAIFFSLATRKEKKQKT